MTRRDWIDALVGWSPFVAFLLVASMIFLILNL